MTEEMKEKCRQEMDKQAEDANGNGQVYEETETYDESEESQYVE